MSKTRTKMLILLCGIVMCAATPLCNAQDAGMPFEVKKPQTEVSPVLFPETINTPPTMPAEAKSDKEIPKKPWLWRFLEMIAVTSAKYNTDKQSDGRPNPVGNSR